MRSGYVLFDLDDRTFHAGGGEWTADPARAELYQRYRDAKAALEEVDQLQILRATLGIGRLIAGRWLRERVNFGRVPRP